MNFYPQVIFYQCHKYLFAEENKVQFLLARGLFSLGLGYRQCACIEEINCLTLQNINVKIIILSLSKIPLFSGYILRSKVNPLTTVNYLFILTLFLFPLPPQSKTELEAVLLTHLVATGCCFSCPNAY